MLVGGVYDGLSVISAGNCFTRLRPYQVAIEKDCDSFGLGI